MKKEKIENLFSSMEDFSSVPPPELWDAIEKELEKPKKKKRAKTHGFLKRSKTTSGSKVLQSRRRKGRNKITV
jgi:ribosomal protein L34